MNKKIVVTGATKGIGRAIAEKFASNGFDLAVCARSEKDLKTLQSKLQTPNNNIIAQKCDVSKKDEIKAFSDTVLREFGAVDVVVNNAGIYLPGQVYNETDGTLETLMATNLYSAYHLSRALLPAMIKQKNGHIFNLCSVASIQAYPDGGSYSISKFALLGMSKALREELKQFHVKVTALLPGATHTASWEGTHHPDSRFMKAADVAQLVWDIYNLSANTVVEEVLLRPLLGDL